MADLSASVVTLFRNLTPATLSRDCDLDGVLDECEFADCNANGIHDACELARGMLADSNRNGIPDECDATFHRGDANGDGALNISDASAIFQYLLLGGQRPSCLDSADANGDGRVDLADGIYDLNFLFRSGPAPPAPGPPPSPCGIDPSLPGERSPGCREYAACS
jgi:hypothetical protein